MFPFLAAVLLALFEADMLWIAQEQNLLLHTQLFFDQQMVKAGGLLTWMGCYLTQFFYYPMLGAGVLCLLWAFLMWLLQRVFRLDSLQQAHEGRVACQLRHAVDGVPFRHESQHLRR